jgi:hypothetical protein
MGCKRLVIFVPTGRYWWEQKYPLYINVVPAVPAVPTVFDSKGK